MKTLKLIALAASALLFSQCKTTSPTAPVVSMPSLLEARNILTTTRSSFYKFADSAKGNPWKAIMLTAEWVKAQPTVQAIDVRDSTYINIQLKSGMTTTFYFDQIGADGISISRGGHSGEPVTLSLPSNGILSNNSIANHTVLFYGASNKEFYTTYQLLDILNKLDSSPVPLKTKMISDGDCTPQLVETFGNYGLVIIDSHGFPDGYLTGTQLVFVGIPKSEDAVKDLIIKQTNSDTYNKLLTGEIKIAAEVRINTIIPEWQKHPDYFDSSITLRLMTTTKYISELPAMPNTVIFGNTCYSGASQITETWFTTPVQTAWQNKNVISYYGYATADGLSAPVNNGFAKVMLDTFIQRLAINRDSTGIANLQSDGSEFKDPFQKDPQIKLFFKHFGADDYSYAKCGDTITDSRDGQRYATVCIGKQVWMAQNLNYSAVGSVCYDNNAANCAIYGKLYDWNTIMAGAASSTANPSGVQGICPKSWHVPSQAEYSVLKKFVGAAGANALKDSILWKTAGINSSGFSALPGGNRGSGVMPFFGLGGECDFWTATEASPTQGYILFMQEGTNFFNIDEPLKQVGLSCRCVKDP